MKGLTRDIFYSYIYYMYIYISIVHSIRTLRIQTFRMMAITTLRLYFYVHYNTQVGRSRQIGRQVPLHSLAVYTSPLLFLFLVDNIVRRPYHFNNNFFFAGFFSFHFAFSLTLSLSFCVTRIGKSCNYTGASFGLPSRCARFSSYYRETRERTTEKKKKNVTS